MPTYHHQAVDRLGRVSWSPRPTRTDGTVEAVELPGSAWALGVQWHPEMGEDLRVMRALVRAAGAWHPAGLGAAALPPGAPERGRYASARVRGAQARCASPWTRSPWPLRRFPAPTRHPLSRVGGR